MPVLRQDINKEGENPLYFPTLKKIGDLGRRLVGGKSMKKVIDQEVRASIGDSKKPFEDAYSEYVQDFLGHMTGGKVVKSREEAGTVDVKHEDLVGEKDKAGHSKAYLRQTPRQFAATVEKAFRDKGLNPDLVKDYEADPGGQSEAYGRDILKYMKPAYLQMRKWGYTHYELTH
ncbi:hypothetical protein ACFLRF_04830 [Candidatus Altiarchaeota archaeon]